jgi:hypothetical protein
LRIEGSLPFGEAGVHLEAVPGRQDMQQAGLVESTSDDMDSSIFKEAKAAGCFLTH